MPQTTLPAPTINPAIMRSLGFSLQFPLCDGQEPDDVYQGIQIFIDRPNGGALAVEIAVIGASCLSRRWAYPTFFEFSYTDDDDRILAFVRQSIDTASAKQEAQ